MKTCLIVPGLGGSGPEHWQTRWEQQRDDCLRVDLGDWNDPTLIGWIGGLNRAVAGFDERPILVAHSLGCIAVARWAGIAGDLAGKIAGALLVAPSDVERDGADPRVQRFAPMPRRPLPFTTIVVASRDDPCATFERSRAMAASWSAQLHDIGEAGHINAASGLGNWEYGQSLLEQMRAGIETQAASPGVMPPVDQASSSDRLICCSSRSSSSPSMR